MTRRRTSTSSPTSMAGWPPPTATGFVARVAPDGTIFDLKWIDGEEPDVTLHAPKASAICGDRFCVADLDTARAFDRATGASLDAWVVPDADVLNDLAVGAEGTVYVTDTAITLTPQGPWPSGTPPSTGSTRTATPK